MTGADRDLRRLRLPLGDEPERLDRFGPVVAMNELVARRLARVKGFVTHVRAVERPYGCSVEATLADPTGTVVLVFWGRRAVPGLDPGRLLEACGTPRAHRGRTEILNPLYELLAPPGDGEPTRSARNPRSDP